MPTMSCHIILSYPPLFYSALFSNHHPAPLQPPITAALDPPPSSPSQAPPSVAAAGFSASSTATLTFILSTTLFSACVPSSCSGIDVPPVVPVAALTGNVSSTTSAADSKPCVAPGVPAILVALCARFVVVLGAASAGFLLLGSIRPRASMRSSIARLCASRPSQRASSTTAWPTLRTPSSVTAELVICFMKLLRETPLYCLA